MKRYALALAALLIAGSLAFADSAKQGLYTDQSFKLEYDPLGLQLASELYYEIPLSKSQAPLWRSAKIDVGLQNSLSPAAEMVGPFITIQPIAIFNLRLSAQVVGYYETLGFGFYDLAGYSAGYNASSLAPLTARNASGYILCAAPTLQFAVGPLAALDTLSLSYFDVDNGEGFFFERSGDVALAKRDVELVNQAFLLFRVLSGLRLGASDWFLEVPASGYISHRIGATASYSASVSDRLSIYGLAIVGTFLADRYYQDTFAVAGQVGITLRLR